MAPQGLREMLEEILFLERDFDIVLGLAIRHLPCKRSPNIQN
jgi:hypothetical protein